MFTHTSSSSALLVAILSAVALPGTLAFTPTSHGIPSTTCHGSGRVSHYGCIDSSLASSVDAAPAKAVNGEATFAEEMKKKRMAVLLCPAQFCVPVDYTDLLETIQAEHGDVDVVATRVAPLPRTEWIKVAKQLPTKDFIDANLSVKVTLDWYFEAIEQGLAELFAEGGEDVDVCVIGHSIGGWVARAYLGGLSG